MEQLDEHILKDAFNYLKTLSPRAEVVSHSRRLVLAAPQIASPSPWGIGFAWRRILLGTAAGLATVAVFIMVSIMAGRSNVTLTNTNNEEKLLAEARNLEFQIHLGEATYFEESAAVVSMALEKLAGESPRALR